METMPAFGLAHLWAQSDAIIRGVALVLLLMSVTSWYLILARTLRQLRARKHEDAVEAFWAAPDLDTGLQRLRTHDLATIFGDGGIVRHILRLERRH